MNYLIGIDLGTSATKTILFREDGKIIAQESYEYPLYNQKETWAEQNPKDWLEAVLTTIKKVIDKSKVSKEQIKSIGLSGQMHGLIMIDEYGEVIRNAIIWCDGRTKLECDQIHETIGKERLIEITGNPALTGFTLSKIIWMKNNENENYKKCRKILLPKDYIKYELTGQYSTEYSDASGTNLLDINNLTWSKEILEKLEIDEKILPELKKSHEISGYITKEIAEKTGLKEATPVVSGAADNAAAAIGVGVIEEGNALLTIGTSGVIFSPTNTPKIDKLGRVHTFCSAVENKWATLSCTLSAGQSLQWIKNSLFQEEEKEAEKNKESIYKILDKRISEIPIGSNKLIYLPYLMGERSPILDEKAKGAFIGLVNTHDKYNMYRSVLEGVAYSQKQSLDIVRQMGIDFNKLRIGGGGSASSIWTQMFSDTLNCEIESVNSSEIASLGAAILAGVGVGIYEDTQSAVKNIVQSKDIVKPLEKSHEEYMKYYKIYEKLYLNLKESFHELSEINM